MMRACQVEGFHAIACLDHGIAARFQQVVEKLHVELVVFNDHDGLWHQSFPAPGRWRRFVLPPLSATMQSVTKHQMRPAVPRSEKVDPTIAALAEACLGYLA